MRNALFVMVAMVVVLGAGIAEAGPLGVFGRRHHSSPSCQNCTTVSQPSVSSCSDSGGSSVVSDVADGSDQARCQQEANVMASRRFSGHVGSRIGRFEGVGRGGSPGCNTCTPEQYGYRGLRLTGDASARGSDGQWYRVRSWR